MIEITLKFTSVALAAAALNQLNGSQLATAVVTQTPDVVVAAAAPTPKPKAEKPAKVEPVAETPKAVVTEPTAATAQTAAPSVDYPTLQKAVFELVGKVKAKSLDPAEHVLGIAKGFGFPNFAAMKDAGPDGAKHFADALAAVAAKHAELEAA